MQVKKPSMPQGAAITLLIVARRKEKDDAAFGAIAGKIVDMLITDRDYDRKFSRFGKWDESELAILREVYEKYPSDEAAKVAAERIFRGISRIKSQARNLKLVKYRY